MMSEKISEEILQTALKQFSENINHRQRLFIQFFLGVIIVIVGYSVVYTDTEQHAFFWKVFREGNYLTITSYSISSLIGSYIVAQGVLIVLARFILSSGFSFRKYQAVVYQIRKNFLGKEFGKYFGDGDKEFSPYNKSGCFSSNSYLPEFETIFFVFIWALQIILFLTITFKLGTFTHPIFRKIVQPKEFMELLGYKIYLIHFWVIALAFIPTLFTCYFQSKYYFKYLKKIFMPVKSLDDDKTSKEGLIKYRRKISLSWGYMLLFFFFSGNLIIFLITELTTSDKYLEFFEFCLLYGISLLFYCCFLYNLIQSLYRLRIYYQSFELQAIIQKIGKEFTFDLFHIKRSAWAKNMKVLSFKFIIFLYSLIVVMIFLIWHNNNYNRYFIYMSLSYFISTAVILFFWARKATITLVKMLAKKMVLILKK